MKTERDKIIDQAEALCEKFIKKVRTGKARSKETYQECLALNERIQELKNKPHVYCAYNDRG